MKYMDRELEILLMSNDEYEYNDIEFNIETLSDEDDIITHIQDNNIDGNVILDDEEDAMSTEPQVISDDNDLEPEPISKHVKNNVFINYIIKELAKTWITDSKY